MQTPSLGKANEGRDLIQLQVIGNSALKGNVPAVAEIAFTAKAAYVSSIRHCI
jgi:hypothetical protein